MNEVTKKLWVTNMAMPIEERLNRKNETLREMFHNMSSVALVKCIDSLGQKGGGLAYGIAINELNERGGSACGITCDGQNKSHEKH